MKETEFPGLAETADVASIFEHAIDPLHPLTGDDAPYWRLDLETTSEKFVNLLLILITGCSIFSFWGTVLLPAYQNNWKTYLILLLLFFVNGSLFWLFKNYDSTYVLDNRNERIYFLTKIGDHYFGSCQYEFKDIAAVALTGFYRSHKGGKGATPGQWAYGVIVIDNLGKTVKVSDELVQNRAGAIELGQTLARKIGVIFYAGEPDSVLVVNVTNAGNIDLSYRNWSTFDSDATAFFLVLVLLPLATLAIGGFWVWSNLP
jgi:hypothetical protein